VVQGSTFEHSPETPKQVSLGGGYDDRTALLVVDVQNDFADPGGSLYVRGGERLLPKVNRQVQLAISASALLVYTQDWHPPVTRHFEKDGGIWPVHCVRDTWGAEFHPHLQVCGHVIRKGTGGEDGYSGFSFRDPKTGAEGRTSLQQLLRTHGIRRVVICGLATDFCVKETALDAVRLGYETIVLSEAIAAVNLTPDSGEKALEQMQAVGVSLRTSLPQNRVVARTSAVQS
jgi:nicotinamidase/pyrazinamidase